MITASELAAMQATVAGAFDLTCIVNRAALTSDGAGGNSKVYSPVTQASGSTSVGCNLAQPSQQLLQNYDFLIGARSTWLVGLPVGTNVQEDDHLAVGGQTLEVNILLDPKSYHTRLHVLASEIR